MKRSMMMELRVLAKRELLAYRKNQKTLASHALRGDERTRALRWRAAIEGARRYLAAESPEKERAMVRLFGLDAPIPRYIGTVERVLKLSTELHVSDSTLYKWREDIVFLVLGAAIEAGAIRPFGLADTQDEGAGRGDL